MILNVEVDGKRHNGDLMRWMGMRAGEEGDPVQAFDRTTATIMTS